MFKLLFNIYLFKTILFFYLFSVASVTAAVETPPMLLQTEQSLLKTIIVYYENEDDSEQFPSELKVKTIRDLKDQLLELCGILTDCTDVRVILNARELIVNLDKIEHGSEYSVAKKVKPHIIKLYFDKR